MEYNYQLTTLDDGIGLYLEDMNCVLIRVPTKLAKSEKDSKVVISVRRDDIPIPIEIRNYRGNLAFVSWSPEECYGRLTVHVYTKPTSSLESTVLVDYRQPLIDPKLWELLGQSQREANWRMSLLGKEVDRKVKEIASQIKRRASDSDLYRHVDAKKAFDDVTKQAVKVSERVVSNAHDLFARARKIRKHRAHVRKERINEITNKAKKHVDWYMKAVSEEALKVTDKIVRNTFPPKNSQSKWIKRWYEIVDNKYASKMKTSRYKKAGKMKNRR